MRDEAKTKRQLIEDLIQLRQRLADLEVEQIERVQVEGALRQNEALYRSLVQQSKDAIFAVSSDQTITFASPACQEIFGYEPAEFINDPGFVAKIVHPDYQEQFAAFWHQYQKTSEFPERELEWAWIRKDGETVYTENTFTNVFDDQGNIIGFQTIARDITERKRIAERLRRLNRALKTMTECNQTLIRATEEGSLLQDICRIIVEVGGYWLAWVGLVEEDEPGTVRPVAQAGIEAGYLETLNITWADMDRSQDPSITSIRTGQPSLVRSILTDPRFAPWREQALKQGYASSIALPLSTHAQPFGALNIYAEQPDVFDEEEIRLLTELANDLAYGLMALRTRAKHKQAEEALLESEERYRRLVELSPYGIAVHSEGIVVFVNSAGSNLMGATTPQELIGRQALDFIHPDSREEVEQRIQRMIANGLVAPPLEERFVRLDGSVIEVEVVATAFISQGKQAVQVIFHDITERKQVQQELYRRNRELSLLNQVIAATVADLELESILETVCRELALAFDLPQAAAALLNEEKTEAVVVAEYLAEGRPTGLNECIPVKDNPSFQYLLNYKAPLVVEDAQHDRRLAPIHDLLHKYGVFSLLILPLVIEGEVVGSLGLDAIEPRQFPTEEVSLAWSVADQVARMLAWTRLDKEHRLLSTAIEQTAESVIITDTEHIIVYVNPAFERVTGYSRTEALGQKPHLLLDSGRYDSTFYQELWAMTSAGEVWQGRLVNKKKDGTLFTEDATVTPVRDENRAIINYVTVKRDVTHELELEEQYYQAQKMEAIGQLTAGVAHDFNNLLTVINGFAELTQADLSLDDPIQETLNKILASGQRATNLVRQLLAFSRKQIIEPQVLDLNSVVVELEKMLQRIIGEDIVLKTAPAPGLWLVKADPTQLEQIIVNLAVNARDAMPNGGRLTIETANMVLDETYVTNHLAVQPGEYVLLALSDTGTGVSEEVKARIFEPFFTTKELGKGTGLGLATVYGIVKQSGGNIGVYSEEGQGTTFKIYLPRADTPPVRLTRAEAGTEMLTGSEIILLVEDDPPVRDLARQVLQGQGYVVLEAEDAREALHLSTHYSGPIQLLLTDVVMPGMSGKVLAEQLTQTYPLLKVLFMSGYTDEAIAHHGVLDVNVAFLQKPFSPLVLTRKVREVLDS